MNSIEIFNKKDFEKQLEDNKGKNIFIFKYSSWCPISKAVEKGYDKWLEQHNFDNVVALKINVLDSRPLSKYVEEVSGVVHESPQFIMFTPELKVVATASHYDVSSMFLDSLIIQ